MLFQREARPAHTKRTRMQSHLPRPCARPRSGHRMWRGWAWCDARRCAKEKEKNSECAEVSLSLSTPRTPANAAAAGKERHARAHARTPTAETHTRTRTHTMVSSPAHTAQPPGRHARATERAAGLGRKEIGQRAPPLARSLRSPPGEEGGRRADLAHARTLSRGAGGAQAHARIPHARTRARALPPHAALSTHTRTRPPLFHPPPPDHPPHRGPDRRLRRLRRQAGHRGVRQVQGRPPPAGVLQGE